MLGECSLLSSLSRRTVCGFPRPQQFQLRTTEEAAADGCENPKLTFARLFLLGVEEEELTDEPGGFLIGLAGPVMSGESHVLRRGEIPAT